MDCGRQTRRDVLEADLLILGATEVYSNIRANGRTYLSFREVPGAWASGDLVTVLRVTRDAIGDGQVSLEKRIDEDGTIERGIAFQQPRESAAWRLFVGSAAYPMAFAGRAWFAASNGQLRTIEWHTDGAAMPEPLKISQVSWQVKFSPVNVGGEVLLAPATSKYTVKYKPENRRSEEIRSTFNRFQRFAGDAKLLE